MSEIISADCHLDFWYLPGDLFYSEAPPSWKERMPRVMDTDSGRAWVHNGKIIRYVGDVGLDEQRFTALRAHARRNAGAAVAIDVYDYDLRAFACEQFSRRAADPRPRAADQRNSAGEARHYSALMLAVRTTLLHFSISERRFAA